MQETLAAVYQAERRLYQSSPRPPVSVCVCDRETRPTDLRTEFCQNAVVLATTTEGPSRPSDLSNLESAGAETCAREHVHISPVHEEREVQNKHAND